MDSIMLLREFSPKNPLPLSENEIKRIDEILKISMIFTKKEKISDIYVEYRNLVVKEKGSGAMLVLFDIVSKFLGEKHISIFQKLSSKVPLRDEGDQYGVWRRSALSETTLKELYAYLMSAYLRTHDQIPVEMSAVDAFQEEERAYLADRSYQHVLPVKDIMMAKAGDDSPEIDKDELRLMINEFLKAVSEVIV